MSKDLSKNLTAILEEMSATADDLYEIQKELKAEVENDYDDNYEAFIEDLSHNADYYTLTDLISYCYDDMID